MLFFVGKFLIFMAVIIATITGVLMVRNGLDHKSRDLLSDEYASSSVSSGDIGYIATEYMDGGWSLKVGEDLEKEAEQSKHNTSEISQPEDNFEQKEDETDLVAGISLTEEVLEETLIEKDLKTQDLDPEDVDVANVARDIFAFDQGWRNAVVNIFCLSATGKGSTGSGVIIDPSGVILTNAHVADTFLFVDFPVEANYDCQIRTGSPAYPRYRARLLYIPHGFIEDSLAQQYQPDDSGWVYGRKDYALLVITERTNPTESLPASFPYMPFSLSLPTKGSYGYVLGYPAASLGGTNILRDLYAIASPVIVDEFYAIENSNKADIISLTGSIAGQQGASGGAMIGKGGSLVGIPSFLSDKPGLTTADNILNAITLEYISRDLQIDTGLSLSEFVAGDDLQERAEQFMSGQGLQYANRFYDLWQEREGPKS